MMLRSNVPSRTELGARYRGNGQCYFQVWAPLAEKVEVHISGSSSSDIWIPMKPRNCGYHEIMAEKVFPGSIYRYRLDGKKELADPASQFQPQGVHGPSQIVDPSFAWGDGAWSGLPLQSYILYEIHVGTFTREGTFDAIIPRLNALVELGVTAIELMPVAQFPGNRNWGYDGVFPFAVQDSYGGPFELKRLVKACHHHGLAVVLDVVYNHLGPEGNYFAHFGSYFSDRYRTPWGHAINFDGPESDEVRQFFIQNALYWVSEFHFDALRLDAVHAIFDQTAVPFLQELADAVHECGDKLNRRIHVISESSLNDTRLLKPKALGGYGFDAQWNDDFHHSLHTLLTSEREGYYQDFGKLQDLAKSYAEGYVYSGQYSAYRRRRHGHSSQDVASHRFVVCAQNHDQIGNRRRGERLSQLVAFASLKLAAGVVLLSPFVPLLFMGEEYGETSPFLYFTSHADSDLIEAVRNGRKREFSSFGWQGEIPDPQAETTFESSKLNRPGEGSDSHHTLYEFYRELIRLRTLLPCLSIPTKENLQVIGFEEEKALFVSRRSGEEEAVVVFNFGDAPVLLDLPLRSGDWQKRMDSAEERWGGTKATISETVHSDGKAQLALEPRAFVLFSCIDHPPTVKDHDTL